MQNEILNQTIVFFTLGLALLLFIWGKLRYDLVALLSLLILVLVGIVPAEKAFEGFAHAAVITVAAVLIVSKALENSGVVDVLANWLSRVGKSLQLQIIALTAVVMISSGFMNNIGALAILMPVAIQIARRSGHSPSHFLMPLAFASLLGGLVTMIGTPPNIIIAMFRAEETGAAFKMFDFTPVGAGVALLGTLFVSLLGWRLLPKRAGGISAAEAFQIEDYITEVRVQRGAKMVGKTVGELGEIAGDEVQVLGLIRRNKRLHIPKTTEELKTNDIIIVESDSQSLKSFLNLTELKLAGSKKFRRDAAGSKDVLIAEVVVGADASIIEKTASGISLRTSYGVNLLGISRRGQRLIKRVDKIRFQEGDVLLLQGRAASLQNSIAAMGCLPLVERELQIGQPKRVMFAVGIFAIAMIVAALGIIPVQISFVMAAFILVVSGLVSVRNIYTSVDWPIIILLGAMIPVGAALETTGGAALIANRILDIVGNLPGWTTITLILVLTMFLSDLINNAAAAVLMAPISISIARELACSIDPFLMAVAVGTSCAFLTPIGHQSNTLVMGPGGYKFSDYWRMGVPLEIIIVAVAVPLILWVWPL
ncbi:MAG: SLC13 family permease [bacterium]|nr:SLC13 family permease [bacterium]